jgi:formylglycine-generating enzyme
MRSMISDPALTLLRRAWPLALLWALAMGTQAGAAPRSFRDCAGCPQMVTIPAGTFTAGSTPAETSRDAVTPLLAAREQPQTAVTIARPFAIGRFVVTRGEFARFAKETGYAPGPGCSHLESGPDNKWAVSPGRNWRNPGIPQTDRHPVVCVSYLDATAYAEWLSRKTGHRYRLPTGSEWEYAARAGASTARYWGDDRERACEYANVSGLERAEAHGGPKADLSTFFPCRDGYVFTSPVGRFKPNAFGLYDVLGNVHQLTADCVAPSLATLPPDGGAIAGDCTSHIDRGGSWSNSPRYLRLASRHADLNDARNTVLGFRVLRELP